MVICNLFFLSIANTQNCSVLFQSKASFKVAINKFDQHQNFQKNLFIDSLSTNNQYQVEVNFKDDTLVLKKILYLFDEGFIHLYHITKKEIQLTKIQPLLTYQLSKNIFKTSYTGKALPLIVDKDTTTKDTTYKVPFDNYYKLDDYTGKIGCPFPIKDEELAEVKRIVIAENLEDSKLEKAKGAIQEMDSACVMVEQTKEIIVLLEYEETKLDLAKFMYAYTFDLENYKELSEVFNFENSMDELNAYIKTKEEEEE